MYTLHHYLTKPLLLFLLACQGGTALAEEEIPFPVAEVDFLAPTHQASTFLEHGATMLKVVGSVYLLSTYRMYYHNLEVLKVAAEQGKLNHDRATLQIYYDQDKAVGNHYIEEALSSEAEALTKRGLRLCINEKQASKEGYAGLADLPRPLLAALAEARYYADASLLGSAVLYHDRATFEEYLSAAKRDPENEDEDEEEQSDDNCHLCRLPLQGVPEAELCQCKCSICQDFITRPQDEDGNNIALKPLCYLHPEKENKVHRHAHHIECISQMTGFTSYEKQWLKLAIPLISSEDEENIRYYKGEASQLLSQQSPAIELFSNIESFVNCPSCRSPASAGFRQAIEKQMTKEKRAIHNALYFNLN